MKKIVFRFVLLAIIAGQMSCSQQQKKNTGNELTGKISISGAFALYPLTVKWAEEFQKLHPGVKIDISAGGAGKGMADALSGMVDLGMFSREVSREEIAKGAWYIALTKDAVLPTINASNPLLKKLQRKGITKEGFKNIFVHGKVKYWDELTGNSKNHKINVYTRSDACGAAAMWAQYLGVHQEDLLGTGVFGDPGVADAVKNDVSGIGYNNVIYVYDIGTRKKYEHIEVVPVDFNGNGMIDAGERIYDSIDLIMAAIKEGAYPSPPARELYFVSKGKPQSKVVKEFIQWILTDGQKYVHEAGYVQLSANRMNEELKKLETTK